MRYLTKYVNKDYESINNFVTYGFINGEVGRFDRILPCTIQINYDRFTPAVLYKIRSNEEGDYVIDIYVYDYVEKSQYWAAREVVNEKTIDSITTKYVQQNIRQAFIRGRQFQEMVEKKDTVELVPGTIIHYNGDT